MFLLKGLSVQSNDLHRLRLMAPVFLSLGMGEVLGISSSMSIFNVRYGVEHLPVIYVLEAAGLLISSALIADMAGRVERPRFLRGSYVIMAGLVLLNGMVLLFTRLTGHPVLPVFYPVLLVSSMVVFFQMTPLIWLIAVDICPTQQAKRLFPILAGSSTTGCILAGIVGRLMAPVGVEFLYLLWAIVLAAGGYFLFKTIHYYISPLEQVREEEAMTFKDSVTAVCRSRFLFNTTGLLTLIMTLFFLMDYQFNSVARQAYSDEGQLAAFLALFLAISNAVAVVIELGFLSRIMALLGVGNIILLVAAGLAVCFTVMFFFVSGPLALAAVFVSCLVCRILVNVLGEPAYQLLFKVVPSRQRDGVRFLVEALFILGGMLGGAALSGLHSSARADLRSIAALAVVVAAIAVYVAIKARSIYLNELINCISSGIADIKEETAAFAGRFLPPDFFSRLFSFLHHPDDRKRAFALDVLGQVEPQSLQPVISELLGDSCAEVRITALKACLVMKAGQYEQGAVLACCNDVVPEVRAAAVSLLPITNPQGTKLYEALGDPDPMVVAEAVITICESREGFDSDQVRAAVERCLQGGVEASLVICRAIGAAGLKQFSTRLMGMLEEGPGLRAAAAEALGRLQCTEAIPKIINVYTDTDREFQRVAGQALINMGEKGVPSLLAQLESSQDIVAWGAIAKALAVVCQDREVRVLVDSCVEKLQRLAGYNSLPGALSTAETDNLAGLSRQRCQEIYTVVMDSCWVVLGSLYDPFVINKIKAASRESDVEIRETSLEVLTEGLADRRMARAMMEILGRQETALKSNGKSFVTALIKEACAWDDYWLAEIASAALQRLEGGRTVEGKEMLSLLDKVLLLKDAPLFSYLTLEELGILARIARQEIHPENTLLLQEGENNRTVYVIANGHIELSAHSGSGVKATVGVLNKGEALGDTTVFDEALSPVCAQIILGEAALLAMDGEEMQRLCSIYPNIANGFIRAMSSRVRRLEQMLIKMA